MIYAWIGLMSVGAVLLIVWGLVRTGMRSVESPKKAAGRRGEALTAKIIQNVLREDDKWYTNVVISFDGREAELDNVIVNENGVCIIEVKNYSGRLEGEEDDYEWIKYHTSAGSNTYKKQVRNPISQVKRQIYILANYLRWHGIDVWVEGYVYLLRSNSPVKSGFVLTGAADIDRALHADGKARLDGETIRAIAGLLE